MAAAERYYAAEPTLLPARADPEFLFSHYCALSVAWSRRQNKSLPGPTLGAPAGCYPGAYFCCRRRRCNRKPPHASTHIPLNNAHLITMICPPKICGCGLCARRWSRLSGSLVASSIYILPLGSQPGPSHTHIWAALRPYPPIFVLYVIWVV